MKGFLISGDRSGSGKTSITLAIAAALAKRWTVQTFKVGMDYIDPSYLTGVTGRACRNLDSFVMNPDELSAVFDHACMGADIAIVEGVRGLYEGAESIGDIGSTASIAKHFQLPIILVIDARSITQSAAALLMGFMQFDHDIRIAGVILNNVRGEKHIRKATEAIHHFCHVPVIGAIPRVDNLDLTMRHLGLVPFEEGLKDQPFLDRVSSIVEMICSHLDLDALLSLSREMKAPDRIPDLFAVSGLSHQGTIGIARDEAFNFYYADLFSLIESQGFEIEYFSPVHDVLPDADGYWFGGGYPEYYGRELEENQSMIEDIRNAARDHRPVIAECGGLMYLCREIRIMQDFSGLSAGTVFQMADVLPARCTIPKKRIVTYVSGTTTPDFPFESNKAVPVKGHAFHYSTVHPDEGVSFGYELVRGFGIDATHDGIVRHRVVGSYTHIHPVPSSALLYSFLSACKADPLS
ncbi:MAG TPA: Ni-sirohydrochlorin a,c-diamide synthase [Methanospirillum sp.]|uniref:Ni-sirohydrochlorin a,c-diamide synthase n=1 Tax=Methanospirillum sp. TaxID=45200 RepID=UPI002C63A904|nr:Ni-sirohydrochlorin a,c-diamide synthase [Methanospirillum sp.]HOJ96266.1 Ni-sirohydrochlorin a,c-diamide synthase [Methanospirillum sp.]HOL40331.1 Ni-sirohydrochlorin a,c-diamide synthase [Methanospirillum sp.]HPP77750.1 Ni-sirohydrochlorin a,c-diamide synthase [Methanospirillum sp.]